MTTFISNTRVEHAPEQAVAPLRDRIVLSEAEIANAYDMAYETPRYAMTFLADQAAAGRAVDPRTRARVEKAMEIVVRKGLAAVYPDEKPEPVVSHTTTVTRRVPSPVVQKDAEGNRFVEAADARGGFRVSLVEREDGADVPPLILADLDSEYSEHDFAGLVAHLNELLVEIDPTGDLRAHAAKAVRG